MSTLVLSEFSLASYCEVRGSEAELALCCQCNRHTTGAVYGNVFLPFLWRVEVVLSREALFVIRESHFSWFFVFQMIPLASLFGESWT